MSKVREINDAFRKGERPELGRIVITSGALHAAAAWPLGPVALYEEVKKYDNFTEDNDPWGEHDYGTFQFAGEQFFFKLDYFDLNYEYGAEDPADETKSRRVLTIALLSEY